MARYNLQWIDKVYSNMNHFESYSFDVKQDL